MLAMILDTEPEVCSHKLTSDRQLLACSLPGRIRASILGLDQLQNMLPVSTQ